MALQQPTLLLKRVDHIIHFGILIIISHGKQLHQAGVLRVNRAKLHKILKYSGLQKLHGPMLPYTI